MVTVGVASITTFSVLDGIVDGCVISTAVGGYFAGSDEASVDEEGNSVKECEVSEDWVPREDMKVSLASEDAALALNSRDVVSVGRSDDTVVDSRDNDCDSVATAVVVSAALVVSATVVVESSMDRAAVVVSFSEMPRLVSVVEIDALSPVAEVRLDSARVADTNDAGPVVVSALDETSEDGPLAVLASTSPMVAADVSIEVAALEIKVPLEVKSTTLPDDSEVIDPASDVVRPISSVVAVVEWVVAIDEPTITVPPWGSFLGLHADDRRTSGLIWGVKGEERASLLLRSSKRVTGREDAVERVEWPEAELTREWATEPSFARLLPTKGSSNQSSLAMVNRVSW
ncbi:hypothetical protein HG531_000195 [Fusarium graminearum]|nr:hypothetical protein HG531_000195 [Fusarium graminearum]